MKQALPAPDQTGVRTLPLLGRANRRVCRFQRGTAGALPSTGSTLSVLGESGVRSHAPDFGAACRWLGTPASNLDVARESITLLTSNLDATPRILRPAVPDSDAISCLSQHAASNSAVTLSGRAPVASDSDARHGSHRPVVRNSGVTCPGCGPAAPNHGVRHWSRKPVTWKSGVTFRTCVPATPNFAARFRTRRMAEFQHDPSAHQPPAPERHCNAALPARHAELG